MIGATLQELRNRQTVKALQPAALPASLAVSRARLAPEAAGTRTPANGRSRVDGGVSAGPRTEAGLAGLSAGRTRHGFYGAESQAALRRTDELIAETRALLALVRGAKPSTGPSMFISVAHPPQQLCEEPVATSARPRRSRREGKGVSGKRLDSRRERHP